MRATQPPPVSMSKDSEFFQAGGYAEHLATGLFVHAAYGQEDNNGKQTLAGFTEPDSHQWYVKGGIRRQWLALGHTVLYGEYGQYIDQLGPAALVGGRHVRRVHPVGTWRRAGNRRRFDVALAEVSRA